MSKLPMGWERIQLSEVGEIVTGSTPSTKDINNFGDRYPWVKPTDLDREEIIYKTRAGLSEQGGKIARLLPPESVLVSCIGILGKVGFAGTILATNQQINAVIFNKKAVNSKYGFYFCKSIKPWMEVNASSTTVAILNKSRFGEAPFLLPPLNEQKRIVAKLERLLARCEVSKKRLDKIPSILSRLRQSILAAACSGRLTADWRSQNSDIEPASELLKRTLEEHRYFWEASELEEMLTSGKTPKDDKWKTRYKTPTPLDITDLPEIPDGWCWTNLQSLALIKDPNPSHRYPTYENGVVPLLSTREFEGLNDWKPDDAPLVPEEVYQFQNRICRFSPSDIVFARKGKLGLARRPPRLEKYTFSHTVFIIKCLKTISSDSVLWILRRDETVAWLLQEMNSNTGVPTLGKAYLERLPIPLAPLMEQKEIAQRVEKLFKLTDEIEQRYQKARAYVDKLPQAILAKAFRGELVPQDPNDEPASVLLERIRAERAEQETKKGKAAKGSRGARLRKPYQSKDPTQLSFNGLE